MTSPQVEDTIDLDRCPTTVASSGAGLGPIDDEAANHSRHGSSRRSPSVMTASTEFGEADRRGRAAKIRHRWEGRRSILHVAWEKCDSSTFQGH